MRIAFASLFAASVAWAGARQGDPCATDKECATPAVSLTCKSTSGPGHCEIVCGDKTKCPAEQRCVKDHGARVCRAIVDGPDL